MFFNYWLFTYEDFMITKMRIYIHVLLILLACTYCTNKLEGAAEPPSTGAIIVENNSDYDIIIQMLGAGETPVGPALRISEHSSETIADNISELHAKGVLSLRYGHASDQYAGRLMVNSHVETPGTLTIRAIINAAKRHGKREDIVLTIGNPGFVAGRVVGGTFTWHTPNISFLPLHTGGLQAPLAPEESVYKLKMFASIPKAAQEAKYISQYFAPNKGTPAMLVKVDPDRWSRLILGIHGTNYNENDIKQLLLQRLLTLHKYEDKHIISKEILSEGNRLLFAAARTLLAKIPGLDIQEIIEAINLQLENKIWEQRKQPAAAPSTQPAPSTQQKTSAEPANEMPCPICLEEMRPQQDIVRVEDCGHIFHRSCLLDWMKRQNTCPACRKAITLKSLAAYRPK